MLSSIEQITVAANYCFLIFLLIVSIYNVGWLIEKPYKLSLMDLEIYCYVTKIYTAEALKILKTCNAE